MANEYDDLAASGAKANDYDALIQQGTDQARQRLRFSVVPAVQQNPDEYAKAKTISRETGVPAQVVARNLPEMSKRAQVNSYDALLDSAPVTAAHMSDREFASVAHDDTETLATIERDMAAYRKSKAPMRVGTSDEFGALVKDIREKNPRLDWDSARAMASKQMVVDNSPGGVRVSEGPKADTSSVVAGLLRSLPQGAEQLRQSIRAAFADFIKSDSMYDDAITRYRHSKGEQAVTEPKFESETAKGLYGGGVSLLQQVPGIAASIATGNPMIGLANAGLMSGGTAYGKYRERGGQAGESALGALGEGATEIATELMPMSYMVKYMGKAGAGVFLKGLLAREMPTEQLATVVQDAIDTAIANPTKTWGDYLKERPGAAYQTALAVLVQSGTMGAVHKGMRVMAGNADLAINAMEDAQVLSKMLATSKQSNLRPRDRGSFERFVDSAVADGPMRDVWIDPQVFAATLNQAGIEPYMLAKMMPTAAAGLSEGLASGTDVRIPLGELAAALPDSPLEQTLVEHLRTSEHAPSAAEAQVFFQKHAEEFAKRAETLMADSEFDAAFKQSAASVEKELLTQLTTANRFTADVNTSYAKILSSFYTVQAARLGITPEEMYVKYPLQIQAQQPGTKRTRTMDQSFPKFATTDNGPTLSHGRINIAEPAAWNQEGDTTHYEHVVKDADGNPSGLLSLGWKNGQVTELHNIRVLSGQREAGIGTDILRAILAHDSNGTELHIRHIVPEARQWWINRGTEIFQTEEGEDGILTREAFERANQQRDRGTARKAGAEGETTGELAQGEIPEHVDADYIDPQPRTSPDRAVAKLLTNLTLKEQQKVGKLMAQKILTLLEKLPSANEMAAIGFAGRVKRGWYSESANAISQVFGFDAPRFAMLLAALSPQVPVKSNLTNALNTWNNWIKAGRPSDNAAIREILGRSVQGNKGAGSVLEAWAPNVIRALGNEDVRGIDLSGAKVNSFYANLIGDVEEVTNDTWMARYALIEQKLFDTGSHAAPIRSKGYGYLAFNARVREAAKRLTELTGEVWTPAEVQETVWTWTQAIYEMANSADETRSPSQIIKEGGLEAALSRTTPNFGNLFYSDKYRSILIEAGYADELERLERADAANVAEPGTDATEGETAPFAADAQQRYELRAARRLDTLWRERRTTFNQSARGTGEPGISAAQAVAASAAEGAQKLIGLPDKPMLVAGEWYVPGPFGVAHQAAKDYMESTGVPYLPPRTFARVDVDRAVRIAAEFEKMKHAPNDPEVKAAYDAMMAETLAQWQAIKATGLTVEFIDFAKQGDPYSESPRAAIMDVVNNNHLWVFPTEGGFGSDDTDVSGNPLLTPTDEVINGRRLVVNDVFRIVHDYFGHIKEGNGFRADGEENAWRSHAAMYSPLARRAMTSETRGQNSWVNYGPHGATNRAASAADTHYAPQKIGLMPLWVSEEGRIDSGKTEPVMPDYGTAQPGAVSAIAIHFSTDTRAVLESSRYGTGMRDAAFKEVMAQEDPRIKQRIHFYVSEGKGVRPESSVGAVAHAVRLNNLYDAAADPLGIWRQAGGPRKSESAVVDAGFDGYYARGVMGGHAGAAVLLGPHSVPVTKLGFTEDANKVVGGTLPRVFAQSAPESAARAAMDQILNDPAFQKEMQANQKLVDFRNGLMVSVDARVAYGALLAKHHTWDHEVGATLLSKKTGETFTIVGRSFTGQGQKSSSGVLVPTYLMQDSSGNRNFFLEQRMQETNSLVPIAKGGTLEQKPVRSTRNTIVAGLLARGETQLPTPPGAAYDKFTRTYAMVRGQDGGLIKLTGQQTIAKFYFVAHKAPVVRVGLVYANSVVVDREGWYPLFREGRGTADDSALEQNPRGWESAPNERTDVPPVPGGNTRGMISFGSDITASPTVITLLQNADLSTFLHEMGHFQLEVLTHMASQPDAPPAVVADVAALMKWFGVTDLAQWNAMSLEEKRGKHEQFARGFEAYLFEGKSPNVELNGIFARFRAWMVSVYKQLAGLNVQLTDEVRGVMNRLVATDEQIAAAEAAQNYAPLFDTKPEGMTDAEWVNYQRLPEEATQAAVEQLQSRSLRDMLLTTNARARVLARLQKDAADKRKAVRAEVSVEVNARPEYSVQNFMKYGKLPDGTQAVGAKMSLAALKDMYGDGPAAPWRYFNTGKYGLVTTDTDGALTPDQLAEMFGFTSGDEMVRKILAADPPRVVIEGMTDQRMLERYGDLVDQDSMERAANAAIHNEARQRSVATEYKALAKAVSPIRAIVQGAKDAAKKRIAQMKIRDIHPNQYSASEARAAKAAMKAKDLVEKKTHKLNELLNSALANEAQHAVDQVEKDVAYLKRVGGLTSIDAGYREQIDALLDRYDLRKLSNKDIARKQSLLQWVEQQHELGLTPVIDESLLNEAARTPYRELTTEEFRGLVDAVRNIEHLGRLKNKLLALKDKREFAAIVEAATASIEANAKRTLPVTLERNSWTAKMKTGVAEFFALHRKFANMMREMDGYDDNGVLWNLFVKPMNDAGNTESVMREQATVKLTELMEPILATGKLRQKMFIPQINASLSREGRIMVALNTGNEGNLQRLMDGDHWSDIQVKAITDTLTKEEWDFVQAVWDMVGGYRGEIGAQQKRLTGVEPEWVDAAPVQTKFGVYRGGYLPVKYDTTRSTRALADEASNNIMDLWRAKRGRAKTRDSFTKARASAVVDRPMRKDFGVITQHITEVTHRLAWQEYLNDAGRLLRASAVDNAIRDHYGPEVLTALRNTLEDVAAGEVGAQNSLEASVNYLRHGATIAGLGWRLTTALLQPIGLTQSWSRIGIKHVAAGMAEWLGDAAKMENTAARIYEKSDMMRLRGKTMQREISEIRNKVAGKSSAIEGSFFYMIQKLQLVADIPTWLGQYHKAVDSGANETDAVAQADQAVLDAQGGGQIKDLAGIQRGGVYLKLFTNFYSFFNTTFNLTSEAVGRTNFKSPLSIGLLAGDFILLYTLPAVLGTLMKAALHAGGGGDEEKKLWRKLIADQLTYMFGTMVGLRELAGGLQTVMGLPGDYQGPAGVRFAADVAKLGKQVAQGEVDQAALKALNDLGGVLFHYPAGQINATATGMAAMIEGRTTNPGALAVGAPAPR